MPKRLLVGAMCGVVAATGFSIWVLLADLVTGGASVHRLGVSVWTVVGVYFLALPVCGVLAVLLQPLLWRSAIGALTLGGLAAFPAYLAVLLSLSPTAPLRAMLIIGVVLAFGVGGAVALSIWRDDHRKASVEEHST